MTGIFIVCASVAAVGVDYGWQPVAGGGIEYIIQIEPQMLDSLRAGQDIFSDLPRTAGNIRSYRITSGTGPIPHGGEPLPAHEVNRPGSRSPVGPSFRGDAVGDTQRARAERPAGGAAEQQTGESQTAALDDLLPGPVLEPAHSAASGDEASETPAAREPNGNRSPRRLADPPSKPLKHELTAGPTDSPKSKSRSTASRHAKPAGSSTPATKKSSGGKAPPTPSTATDEIDKKATRPNLALLGLFASLGCNVFLLWVATGQRSRYRALARRLIP